MTPGVLTILYASFLCTKLSVASMHSTYLQPWALLSLLCSLVS
jgi:hypothetical protein